MDGVGLVAKNYAYWLNRRYGKGYVITPATPGYTYDDKIPVMRFFSLPIPKKHPYRFGVPWLDFSFRKAVRKIRFDIIHAHCPFVSGMVALRIAKRHGIPLVASFHTKYHEDFKSIIRSKLILNYLMKRIVRFYERADVVWVPNNATITTLREYGYKGDIEVMPNGTDITPPKDTDPLRESANKEFRTTDKDFVMLFIGQMRWEKNLRLIIDALGRLVERKRFKMIFVGEGPAMDEIQALVKKRGLVDHVRFLGVVRDRKRIESYYARADLFLFPSLYDTSPLVLREAAAFKLPLLFVEKASAAEDVVDRKNGFLSANNVAAYADKILAIMKDKRTLAKAGTGARSSFYRTWEQTVDEVAQRYRTIIEDYRRVHG